MKRARFNEVWLALAIGLIIASMRLVGCRPVETAELRLLDYRQKQRGLAEHTDAVAIVAIDNASVEQLGRWPWPRARMAELIERLTAAEPAVIGIDGVWSEAASDCGAEALGADLSPACRSELQGALDAGGGDARLARALSTSERAVLGYFFDFQSKGAPSKWDGEGTYAIVRSEAGGRGERRVPQAKVATRNLEVINRAARSRGYFNFVPDVDGLYRRAPMVLRFDERMVTPLSLTMLAVRWPERPLAIGFGEFGVTSVQLGSTRIPVTEDGQLLVNYRGAKETFPHYSAADVLAGKLPPEALKGKFVLIGATAVAVGDIRATPLDGTFPGVEIHANVLDNILRHDFVFQATTGLSWPTLIDIAIIVIGSLLLAMSLRSLRGVRGALIAGVLVAGFLGLTQVLFAQTGVALRVVYPSVAFALTYLTIGVVHYVAAERETRQTRRMLDLYLSPSVAQELSTRPDMIKLGGEKSERTVLFSDVKSFTSISEKLNPEDLVELLNLYLGEMTDTVFAYDGMLDKYIGDGLMAVWGAPLPQAEHAALACRAALGMVERLIHVNEHAEKRGWPPLHIRIGINSGEMVFGNMGSAQHLSLTVMGDNVNLASRLEGINKVYGSTIIAADSTVQLVGDEFVWRELDWVRVKGKTQPVKIFELLGPKAQRAEWTPLVRHFSEGLEAFRQQRWSEAARFFERARDERADDGPTTLYLHRCREYEQQPPPPDWEAVLDSETK